MNENFKKSIEELKEVMMDLYRSAGTLDELIRLIEGTSEEYSDDVDYMNYFMKMQARFRMDHKHNAELDILEDRERSIWQDLIKSTEES